MNATRKVKLKDISENLVCNLCSGYMIDATTVVECLHSFCKSCIVKHLDNSEYCPVCEVQLHSTKPLCGIRPDLMLQEIIYKLVPRLFLSEMERKRKFYKAHPEFTAASQIDSGQIYNQPYITSDDKINISLEYFTADESIKKASKRYFHCPAEVSVLVLKKLVQGKHEFAKISHIDIMYGERILPEDFLLMDIAYKYSWTDSGTKPLQLTYRIRDVLSRHFQNVPKSPKPQKRNSRSLTDSEVLKTANINSLYPTTPKFAKLTPNGKVRGRKKRVVPLDEQVNEVRKKKPKKSVDKTPTKEMESQSDSSFNFSPSCNSGQQKEVQLHISENGVISAKAIVVDDHLKGNSLLPIRTTQTSDFLNTSGQNFNYVTLNIPNPTLSGSSLVANAHTNSKPLTNGHCPVATTPQTPKQASKGKLSKKKLDATIQMLSNGAAKSSKKSDSEANKTSMKKTMLDLQKQNLDCPATVPSPSLSTKNEQTSGKPINSCKPSNGIKSQMPPLPFPLAALASSGMTVNVIPSSDVKSNINKEGTNGSTPAKKFKHQTTIVNGDLKFTSSSRNIVPSPVKGNKGTALENGESSPKKPPKFFKSRHPSANVSSSEGESPNKSEKAKSPLPLATSVSHTFSHQNGFNSASDLKLINSTSSKKSCTTTTNSRMNTTPSTSTVQQNTTLSPAAISQLIQYWNPLFPQHNLMPFVTNDYISMPFLNQRQTMDLGYPMMYANGVGGTSSFGLPFLHNGIGFNGVASSVLTSTSSSDSSSNSTLIKNPISSKKTSKLLEHAENTSLDLSCKKVNTTQDDRKTKSNNGKSVWLNTPTSKQLITNSKECTDSSSKSLSSDSTFSPINGTPATESSFPSKIAEEETNNLEKELEKPKPDQLLETIQQDTLSKLLPVNCENENSASVQPINAALNGSSCGKSDDENSTDLIINEDMQPNSPSINIESEKMLKPCEISVPNTSTNTLTKPNFESTAVLPNGFFHEDSNKSDEERIIKDSPICNNNNEPPADSIPQQKLAESSKTTTSTSTGA